MLSEFADQICFEEQVDGKILLAEISKGIMTQLLWKGFQRQCACVTYDSEANIWELNSVSAQSCHIRDTLMSEFCEAHTSLIPFTERVLLSRSDMGPDALLHAPSCLHSAQKSRSAVHKSIINKTVQDFVDRQVLRPEGITMIT